MYATNTTPAQNLRAALKAAGFNARRVTVRHDHSTLYVTIRDALASLGVSMMSAGSHTEPGGYTRQGAGDLHRTVRGRIVAPEFQNGEDVLATGQFEISDKRSPAEVAAVLRRCGFEPVWKDWDPALLAS